MAAVNYNQTHGGIPFGPQLPGGGGLRPINLNTLVNMEIVNYPQSFIRYYKLRQEFIRFYIRFLDADGKHDFYSKRGGDSNFRTNSVMDMLHRTSFGKVTRLCSLPNQGTQRNPLYQHNHIIQSRILQSQSPGSLLLDSVNDYYNSPNFKLNSQDQYNGFHDPTRRGQVMALAAQENDLNIHIHFGNHNLLLYTLRTCVNEEEIILAKNMFNNQVYNPNGVRFIDLPHHNGVLYKISGVDLGQARMESFFTHMSNHFITSAHNQIDTYYRSNFVNRNNIIAGFLPQDINLSIIATKDTTNAGFARRQNYGGINQVLQVQGQIFGINGRIDGNYVENQVSLGNYYYFPDVSIYMTLFDDNGVLHGCIYMVKWFKSVGMNNIDTVTRIFFITLIKNPNQPDIQWLYANQDNAFQQAMTIGLNQVNTSQVGAPTQNASLNSTALPNIVNDVCFMDTLPDTIGPEVANYKSFCNNTTMNAYGTLNYGNVNMNILNQLRRCAIAIYDMYFTIGSPFHLLNANAIYTKQEFIIAFILRYKQKGDESHATDAIQLEATIPYIQLNGQQHPTKSIVCTNDQYLAKLLLNLNQSYVISSPNQRTFYFAPKDIHNPVTGIKREVKEVEQPANKTEKKQKSSLEQFSKQVYCCAEGAVNWIMGGGRIMSRSMVMVTVHDLKYGFTQDYSLHKIKEKIKKHILDKKSLTELEAYNFKYHVVTSRDRRQKFTFREVIIESVIALNNIVETFETDVTMATELRPHMLKEVLQLEFDINLVNLEDDLKKLIELCNIDYSENDPEDYTPFDINLSIIQHWLETINIYRELTLRERLIQLLILRARWILSLNRNNDYDGIETDSEIELRNILNPCLNQLLEENKSPIPLRRSFSLSTLSNLFSGGNSKKTKKRIKSTNKNYKRKVQTRRLINQTSKNKSKNKTQNIRYN
jgi:hypothetical protein